MASAMSIEKIYLGMAKMPRAAHGGLAFLEIIAITGTL